MATIVAEGKAANLTTTVGVSGRVPDPTVRRFITYLTEAGSVHTIIVDAEHATQDAETLLKWFNATRVGAELASNHVGSPLARTAEDVIRFADEAVGIVSKVLGDITPGASATQPQGVN